MPIYEYRCAKCGEFEHMQKITDPPLQRCPQCRKKVTKLISSTSFQLKGSGWYVTDYAGKGAKGGDKAEKSDKTEKSDKAEAKSQKTDSGKGASPTKDSSSSKASAAA
jgi:putative FmdB family regulatory protein